MHILLLNILTIRLDKKLYQLTSVLSTIYLIYIYIILVQIFIRDMVCDVFYKTQTSEYYKILLINKMKNRK